MDTFNIPQEKHKKTKKNKIVFIILIILIILFLIISFSNRYISNIRDYIIPTTSTSILEYEDENQITKAIAKIYDSVICIEVYNSRNNLISTGTGFIYKQDNLNGYIITNNHVIEDGVTIKGLLSNNNLVDLTLTSSDELLDIAVLKIDKVNVLKVATLGNSENMKLGNTVFAVGSPMGSAYAGTVTKGIIAGKNRMVETSGTGTIVKVIQTDAAINPGNSGGPLVNLSGEVIGITSLKLVDTNIEGMGFAIPIEDITKYLTKLENKEKILRPLLGLKLLDLTDSYYLLQNNISINQSIENGVVVESAQHDYPAYKAGIRKGDVIAKINDISTDTVSEFRYYLYKYNVGDTVKITYIRGATQKTVDINLSMSQ
ncbi:MAG TPA: S1C family serine protease [Bacilli bacterium]|nr:S1C family serine protease [Bacilli bacterium]